MVDFQFSQEQRLRAYHEGLRRQSINESKGLKGRNKAPVAGREAQEMHLLGAAGEMAVAAFLGLEEYLYGDEMPVRGSCDLPGIDVKARKRHWHDLLIQLDDDPSKVFVLVTIHNKRTLIHGWITGFDGMQESWIRSFQKDRPCYAVPKSQLKPMEELQCRVAAVLKEKTAGLNGKKMKLF
jgi:hypothetical protein